MFLHGKIKQIFIIRIKVFINFLIIRPIIDLYQEIKAEKNLLFIIFTSKKCIFDNKETKLVSICHHINKHEGLIPA